MGATHAAIIPAQGHNAGETSLARLFATVCARHGERVAVSMGTQHLTYAALDELSDRIASGLLERGVRPGSIVALYLERSVAMIAAMLAVIKAGAAYLPLDTRYPQQRIAETLADACSIAVIGSLHASLAALPTATLYLRIEDLVVSSRSMMTVACTAGDAAYVIYTSGSTGQPKGVVVSQANVARLISSTEALFHLTEQDVWTMFHSFAFDFSVWEIWGALLTGGRIVVVPYEISRAPDAFYKLLLDEQVTVLNQTPSAFALLDAQDARIDQDVHAASPALALRLVIFGGEALNPALLKGWFSRHAENAPRLVNMYGITETTVHVTQRTMSAADALTEYDSLIGEPLADLQLYLLDDHLCPVPAGVEGEICVAGAGVTRGYLNRPQLDAERFVPDPFDRTGARLYRSGDMARRRADGELVYLGRRDGQVKINGFRIELGEIEAALLTHRSVRQAVVMVVPAEDAEHVPTRLAAFVVASERLSAHDLSTHLRGRLPAHMLPAFYQQLPAMPLNANGKIDRKALPAVHAGGVSEEAKSLSAAATHAASETEDIVAAEWRRVLHATAISFDDNFLDVGGTSLLLIAVCTGLEQRLKRTIPITWMFEHASVRALARRLSEPATHSPARPQAADANAQKQRDSFARARAQRQGTRPATSRSANPVPAFPAPDRSIA